MSKKCTECGIEKPLSEFYKHPQMSDGYLGKCKPCHNSAVKLNYQVNRDHYVKYERKRCQDPRRKKKALEYQKTRRAKYPERFKARNAVSNAIRDGRLTRQPCEVCGDIKSQAHHEDYSRPLDVQWLCFKHHRETHGQTVSIQ